MGMKDRCRLFIEVLFIIFNIIAALMGFIIVILGVVSLASSRYLYITNLNWAALPSFLIVAGIVLMVFAALGVCGAMCEIKLCLIVYMFGLTACIAVIFIISIAGFIWRDVLDDAIHESLENNLNLTKYNILVDEIQQIEKCCGVENYTDWFHTVWALNHSTSGMAVPTSCCRDKKNCATGENGSTVNSNDIYDKGCYSKVVAIVTEYYYAFIIAVLLFCLFLVSGEIVTWYLICTSPPEGSRGIFKKKNRYETV